MCSSGGIGGSFLVWSFPSPFVSRPRRLLLLLFPFSFPSSPPPQTELSRAFVNFPDAYFHPGAIPPLGTTLSHLYIDLSAWILMHICIVLHTSRLEIKGPSPLPFLFLSLSFTFLSTRLPHPLPPPLPVLPSIVKYETTVWESIFIYRQWFRPGRKCVISPRGERGKIRRHIRKVSTSLLFAYDK